MIIRPPQQGQRDALRRKSFGVTVLEVTVRLGGRAFRRGSGAWRDALDVAGSTRSNALYVAGSTRSGKQAVVANAVEAAGQHVQEKARADELRLRRASWS